MSELQYMKHVEEADLQPTGTYETVCLYCVHIGKKLSYEQFISGEKHYHYFLTLEEAVQYQVATAKSEKPIAVSAVKLPGTKGPVYLLVKDAQLLQEPTP